MEGGLHRAGNFYPGRAGDRWPADRNQYAVRGCESQEHHCPANHWRTGTVLEGCHHRLASALHRGRAGRGPGKEKVPSDLERWDLPRVLIIVAEGTFQVKATG